MPKYEVIWNELRYVKCIAEVEAKSKKDAIEIAQSYEVDVEEIPEDGYQQFEARVEEIED